MVSLLQAVDVSWHHHARDDWWKHSGCILFSATLEESRAVIKRYECTPGCSFLICSVWSSGVALREICSSYICVCMSRWECLGQEEDFESFLSFNLQQIYTVMWWIFTLCVPVSVCSVIISGVRFDHFHPSVGWFVCKIKQNEWIDFNKP